MNIRRIPGLSVLPVLPVLLVLAASMTVNLGSSDSTAQSAETTPEFTEILLKDPEIIETGRQVWQDQCRHCHGKSAYPGKAPKLKPRRYKPDFVYDRVTNGFRKMPAWKEVYSQDERVGVVAFILSKDFSP